MLKKQIQEALEHSREKWKKIAIEHGWTRDPFCVQIWGRIENDEFILTDSIYRHEAATQDLVVLEGTRKHIELPKLKGVIYSGNQPQYLFQKGDEAIYFPGNWHYIVKGRGEIEGKIYYMLECNEEECEHCPCEDIFLPENELQTYEEYCDHGCNECEHQNRAEYLACQRKFDN